MPWTGDERRGGERRELDESFGQCPQFEACEGVQNELSKLTSELHELRVNAFPNGDVEGHKSYHEARIAAAKAEEAFWTDLKRDLAKTGIKGVLAILLGLLFTGLLVKLKTAVG